MENKIVRLPVGLEICGFCGEKVDSNWNYCPNCKVKFEKIKCSSCSKIVSSNWKYCPHCKMQLETGVNDKKDIMKNANDWLKGVLGD